jgi:hypothetical protein
MTTSPMTTPPPRAAGSTVRRSRGPQWSPRWLDALSVCCVVGAIVFLLLPTAPRPHPIAPAISRPNAARASWPTDSAGAQIVEGNVFSATRRAPSVRFRPPGSEADAPPPSAPSAVTVADDGPRLFGIVSQDGTRRALLQLPGTDSTPHLLASGERRAGYRVVSIELDRVVVVSSAGTRTVRLAARAPSDSSEKHP